MRRIAEFRKENFKLIGSISPDEDKEAFIEGNVVNVLTNKDQLGRRVLMVNCGGLWDTKKVTSDQLFRLFYMSEFVLNFICQVVYFMNCLICSSFDCTIGEIFSDQWSCCYYGF